MSDVIRIEKNLIFSTQQSREANAYCSFPVQHKEKMEASPALIDPDKGLGTPTRDICVRTQTLESEINRKKCF